MAFDLKVVNGTVVDGSGEAPRRTDVGIRDGRIVEVGECQGPADRLIDAEGAVVTPGFVDPHCHYDGQVSWDADLAPSSVHGVTTCVLGNCGVGFAPVRPEDHQQLIDLMQGVEDIPGTALSEGLTWDWESFPDYMNAIDSFAHAIDFCVQVPHDPLRVYVMGERAIAKEAAGAQDIERMREATRAALEAGAVGFSTGRTDNHRSADGSVTPSSEADAAELEGIARAFHGLEHGVLQAVSDFDMTISPERFDAEFDVLERMAAASGGHPLSISLMQRDQAADQWRRIIARAEQASARGTTVRLQVSARPIGVLLGLEATFHPFMGFPSYKAVAHLPLPERVRALSDPAVRERILAEKSEPVSGDGSAIPPLADLLLSRLDLLAFRIFRLGERPDYEPSPEASLGHEAQRKGASPLAVLYDALLESDGKELLYFPIYNFTEGTLDNVHTMITHPLALLGLSDGGAHVGTICDASFPTFMLAHWTRDRGRGRLPVERVVRMLSSDPARYLGLHDRGMLRAGLRADLNVIDIEALLLRRPELVADLPAGGKRFLQRAEGYRATVVAGEVIARDGSLTGARPGRLVRVGSSPA